MDDLCAFSGLRAGRLSYMFDVERSVMVDDMMGDLLFLGQFFLVIYCSVSPKLVR